MCVCTCVWVHVTALHSKCFKADKQQQIAFRVKGLKGDQTSVPALSVHIPLHICDFIWKVGWKSSHVSAGAGRIFDFILTSCILPAAIGNVQSEPDKRSHTFIPRMRAKRGG